MIISSIFGNFFRYSPASLHLSFKSVTFKSISTFFCQSWSEWMRKCSGFPTLRGIGSSELSFLEQSITSVATFSKELETGTLGTAIVVSLLSWGSVSRLSERRASVETLLLLLDLFLPFLELSLEGFIQVLGSSVSYIEFFEMLEISVLHSDFLTKGGVGTSSVILDIIGKWKCMGTAFKGALCLS